MARRFDLFAPMPPETIAHQLKAVMDKAEKADGERILGRGSQYDMALWVQRGRGNSVVRKLSAKMTPESGGTRIRGKVAIPAASIIFMVFWFGFLTFFLLTAGSFTLLFSGESALFSLPFIVIPLVMMAFGGWLFRSGLRDSRDDEDQLLAWLAKTINARPRPTSGWEVRKQKDLM